MGRVDAQGPTRDAGKVADGRLGLVHVTQDAQRVPMEQLPSVGQVQVPRRALDQRDSQCLFKPDQ